MTSTSSLNPSASGQNQSNLNSNIQSSSTSSTSSTIDQLDAGYGTMNDQQEFDSFKKCFNSSENLTCSQPTTMFDCNSQRKYQVNVANKYNQQQANWVQEEAEHERMAQKFIQNNRNACSENVFIDQKLRRSTPNLLLDYNNQISLKNSNSNSYINNNRYHDAGYMNPVVTSTTMTRIQPIQQSSQPQQKVRIVNNVLNNNKQGLPLTKSRHSNILPQNTNVYKR